MNLTVSNKAFIISKGFDYSYHKNEYESVEQPLLLVKKIVSTCLKFFAGTDNADFLLWPRQVTCQRIAFETPLR